MIYSFSLIFLITLSPVMADGCGPQASVLIQNYVRNAADMLKSENFQGVNDLVRDPNFIFSYCDELVENKENMMKTIVDHFKLGNYTDYVISFIDEINDSNTLASVNIGYINKRNEYINAPGALAFKIEKGPNGGCQAILTEAVFTCSEENDAELEKKEKKQEKLDNDKSSYGQSDKSLHHFIRKDHFHL